MLSFKIPSKWTKRDFCWATMIARTRNGADLQTIARDLEMCVEFGFTQARRIGFGVDYAVYTKEVEERFM